MGKICARCKKQKLRSEFNKNSSRKDGLQIYCRDCDNGRAKNYYNKNKDRQKKQIFKSKETRILELKKMYLKYLSDKSCVDCGETNPLTLDHDHKDDVKKEHHVGSMINHGYAWENILKEAAKCDIRCANCHRIRTANKRGWYHLALVNES